jgi:hypothetical protein
MMKTLRLIIPILLLLAIYIIFAWPAYASHRSTGGPEIQKSVADSGDNPWDPGDENNPHPKPHSKSIHADRSHACLICEKKGDNPWDPGDESPISKGGHHA